MANIGKSGATVGVSRNSSTELLGVKPLDTFQDRSGGS